MTDLEKGASSRRYGIWSGNPKGYAEDLTRCVVEVGGNSMWGPANAHQCQRARGHGPNGEYCKQHAPKTTQLCECTTVSDDPVRGHHHATPETEDDRISDSREEEKEARREYGHE